LHESQKSSRLPTSLVLKHKLNLRYLFLRIFPPPTARLHLRDITNSACIWNTLQCSKTDILYSLRVTTVCDRDVKYMSSETASQPGGGRLSRVTCPRGHLSRGTCPDTVINNANFQIIRIIARFLRQI